MAGQFDKFVKILGNTSKPAIAVGAPGQPSMVVPTELNVPSRETEIGGKDTNITQATVNVAKGRRENAKAGVVETQRNALRSRASKRQLEGLKTTTMRLNESTGEAYDTEEDKPTPSGRVMPKRQANPKYLAADAERRNEDIKAETEADTRRNVGDRDPLGETAFNRGEEAKGSTLRSLNGVTYDLKDYNDYLDSVPANEVSKAKAPYDVSDFEPKSKSTTSTSTSSVATPAPTPQVTEPVFKKVDKIKARKGGTLHGVKEVRDFETEHPDSDQSSAATGQTLSEKNKKSTFKEPSKIVGMQPITEPDMDVVEEDMPEPLIGKKGGYTGVTTTGAIDPYNEDGTLAEHAKEGILSTTMREVPSGRPDKVIGHTPVRAPSTATPYTKPTVNKPGNVIPPLAIDTFGNQSVDKVQAEKENKRLRESRGVPTQTTVLDPNKISARPVRGQTPERQAVLGAIREGRAAELADQGQEMTTVAPEVMDTAKRLGRTSMYNLDEDYMNSTSFLAHEAVQKATVAHALGVHNTLGTDEDHLHKYLGGKPLEAKARLAAAFKVVDRNRRGNPPKVAGEFELLRGMVHAGSSPQQTLRAIRSGTRTDVTVNGQTPVLAAGSSENRNVTHNKANKLASTFGATAATTTAPLAGTNRVAVRNINQAPEEATIREFSPAEIRNKGNVPTTDDSAITVGSEPKVRGEKVSKFAQAQSEFAERETERKNLKTTTMRLDAKTGEAYDTEENK
jgi:hypothetical protein